MALTNKLTAIADGFRASRGTTDKYSLDQMAVLAAETVGNDPIIESLDITANGTYTATNCDGYSPITVNVPQDGSPPDEAFVISGDCTQQFSRNHWNWFIEQYGDRITTKDITTTFQMFTLSRNLQEIPFTLNITNCSDISATFSYCESLTTCPKIRGTINWSSNPSSSCIDGAARLDDIEDLFTPEMLDGFSTVKITSAYMSPKPFIFQQCYSLRKIPNWWYKFKLNEESTAFPTSSYTLYYTMCNSCYSLDEINDIPVWRCAGAQTSNMFSQSFANCHRLKNLTFETDNGIPYLTSWKAQIIDLTQDVGCGTRGHILNYNNGITADKEVKDADTYAALKNDPDMFATVGAYSRYNHDSAVNTINSLPDTSAYLATAGGTNTIKFTGAAGSNTDGGAINTLTEEEIAVATAKGWTVTFA